MNFENEAWLARGVVAAACALIALMATCSSYPGIDTQNSFILFILYAVALYGLIPPNLASWVFALLVIVLLCTLVIMFPVQTIAVMLVLFSVFALCVACK